METEKHTAHTIFSRYKLAHRWLNDDDLEIGGGHPITTLKRFYFYLPLLIGSVIVLLGILMEFILFTFCGIPFLLYAVYGIGRINLAIKENRNTTILRNGEIRFSQNDTANTLSSVNIRNYEIKTEALDGEMHLSKLCIFDLENNEHILLILIDDELPILEENMKWLRDFIEMKMRV